MFPTANSIVYYNDAGEPLGWDTPSYDDDPGDPYDDYDRPFSAADNAREARWEEIQDMDDDALLIEHQHVEGDELSWVHDEMDRRDLGDPCDQCDHVENGRRCVYRKDHSTEFAHRHEALNR